jgi:hypothetical protein
MESHRDSQTVSRASGPHRSSHGEPADVNGREILASESASLLPIAPDPAAPSAPSKHVRTASTSVPHSIKTVPTAASERSGSAVAIGPLSPQSGFQQQRRRGFRRHGDTGILGSRRSHAFANLLSTWLPLLLLVAGVAFCVLLLGWPVLVTGDEQRMRIGMGSLLFGGLTSVVLALASPYLAGEQGRFTFDRVRHAAVGLPPPTVKATATMALLLSDVVFHAAPLFALDGILPDGAVVLLVSRTLLLQTPSPQASDGHAPVVSPAATALFWVAFAAAIVVYVVLYLVVLPIVSLRVRSPSHRRAATLIYAGSIVLSAPIAYALLAVMSCTGNYAPALHTCRGAGHNGVIVAAAVLLFPVVAPMLLCMTAQLRLLDDEASSADPLAPKNDAVALHLTILTRGAVLVLGALEFPALTAALAVLVLDLAAAAFVTLHAPSSVGLLSDMFRVTRWLNAGSAAAAVALALLVPRRGSDAELQLDDETGSDAWIVTTAWATVVLGTAGVCAYRHARKHGMAVYDGLGMTVMDVDGVSFA